MIMPSTHAFKANVYFVQIKMELKMCKVDYDLCNFLIIKIKRIPSEKQKNAHIRDLKAFFFNGYSYEKFPVGT